MIINNLSNQLPVYYFSVVFSQTVVGYFALANSLVMMPISIIITSSTTVFLQKAAEVHQYNASELAALVRSLYKRLFILSVVPLFVFALVSEWIFVFLFGNEWREAGLFASLLAMGSIFIVCTGPLSVLFRVTKNEHINFSLNVVFVVVKFLGLLWGVLYDNIIYSIIGFSLASMISSSVTLLWIFKMINLEKARLYRDIMIVGALFALIIFLKL